MAENHIPLNKKDEIYFLELGVFPNIFLFGHFGLKTVKLTYFEFWTTYNLLQAYK